ncbi:hypothetical protein ACQVP2_14225 [Methylobacterium aquaticum]|jgi:hypothetical protein|uniref:Uncharacterized protein n=1 Tax=Methylobacterium aquaticum TaxID=270351 RepID=A0A0J6SZE5_9HYPH|nr:hypothetical protein [Methylobacterium aquaticum]KMO40555.1 hypothetical protein VP06_02330 [Methylobacterium aquaticum]
MGLFSAFEILAETLVPASVGVPAAINPLVIQGYWVQISLFPGSGPVQFNIIFQETTDFKQGGGPGILQAQYIDENGNVNFYQNFFASTGRGFLGFQIFPGQTKIFGVQAIPGLQTDSAVPQSGTGWRGTVSINPSVANALIATPTHRLLYVNGTDLSKATALDAVVYPVATFAGNLRV